MNKKLIEKIVIIKICLIITIIAIYIIVDMKLSKVSDNTTVLNTEEVNNKNLTEDKSVKLQNKNNSEEKISRITIQEFKNELDKNDWIILDLRTTSELKKTWVINWAKQIDFYSSNFKEQLISLDKTKKYLIYCRSWNRSGKTLKIMKDLWFKNVFELKWWMNKWLSSWEKTSIFNQNNN